VDGNQRRTLRLSGRVSVRARREVECTTSYITLLLREQEEPSCKHVCACLLYLYGLENTQVRAFSSPAALKPTCRFVFHNLAQDFADRFGTQHGNRNSASSAPLTVTVKTKQSVEAQRGAKFNKVKAAGGKGYVQQDDGGAKGGAKGEAVKTVQTLPTCQTRDDNKSQRVPTLPKRQRVEKDTGKEDVPHDEEGAEDGEFCPILKITKHRDGRAKKKPVVFYFVTFVDGEKRWCTEEFITKEALEEYRGQNVTN
jgi:hypothetical protein